MILPASQTRVTWRLALGLLLLQLSACSLVEPTAATAPELPGYMIVQFSEDSDGPVWALAGVLVAVADANGAQILVDADRSSLQVLEEGSPKLPTLILRWADMTSLRQGWDLMRRELEDGAPLRVLAAEGLPIAGMPDSTLPNRANTPRIEGRGPASLMLVQGVATDEAAMAVYRGLIQPMLIARGAYYVVYASADGVEVLYGDWEDRALIISRWPDLASARDFWFSDRYQHEAIPARIHASRFTVLLFEERNL